MTELLKTTNKNIGIHKQKCAKLEKERNSLDCRVKTLLEDVEDAKVENQKLKDNCDHYHKKWSTAMTSEITLEKKKGVAGGEKTIDQQKPGNAQRI